MTVQTDSGKRSKAKAQELPEQLPKETRDVAPDVEIDVSSVWVDERMQTQEEWDAKEPEFAHMYVRSNTTASELRAMSAEFCMKPSDEPGSTAMVNVTHMGSLLVRKRKEIEERQRIRAERLSEQTVKELADAEGDTTLTARPKKPKA